MKNKKAGFCSGFLHSKILYLSRTKLTIVSVALSVKWRA